MDVGALNITILKFINFIIFLIFLNILLEIKFGTDENILLVLAFYTSLKCYSLLTNCPNLSPMNLIVYVIG